jgi:hypothetical protein
MESTNYAGMSTAALHRRPIDINGAGKHRGDPSLLLLRNWNRCVRMAKRWSRAVVLSIEFPGAEPCCFGHLGSQLPDCARALSPFHQLHSRVIPTLPELRFARETPVVKSL